MTTLTIETVDKPSNGRDCWGVFAPVRVTDDGQVLRTRIFGPANVLDCCAKRARLISDERHGER